VENFPHPVFARDHGRALDGQPVRVILMKGAQLGATECGLNWIGYIVAHAPGLALLVMPSLDAAEQPGSIP
jgi:phage terminase large subunit GpA-like protein